MTPRYLLVLAAAVALAIGVDFAFVEEPHDVVWGAGTRGYWALFGIGWAAVAALVIPVLAGLVRRPGDHYTADPADEPGDLDPPGELREADDA